MKFTAIFLVLICSHSQAQVDLSEKEKIEQQREVQRKQEGLRDETLKANQKPSESKAFFIEDTGTQFDVDHSTVGYSSVFEKDNIVTGVKFSGAFCAAILNEQNNKKNIRILVGVELPIDADLPINNLIPFAGGGIQVGSGLSLYTNIGLDYRIFKWFKIQAGANFDTNHSLGTILGAGLTW